MSPRLPESAGAVHAVLRNGNLRRLSVAWGATWTGEWALITALSVYAFEIGGVAAVGLVGVVRMAPAAIAGPFASAVAERVPGERALTLVSGIRALCFALAALALATDASPVLVFALAGIAAVVFTAHLPAHGALLPSLCRSPNELTSANVTTTTFESASTLLGPASAALLLGIGEQWHVMAAAAAVVAAAAVLTRRIAYEAPPKLVDEPEPQESVTAAVLSGFRLLATHADARPVIGLGIAQTIVRGILTVLLVVLAIDILGMGGSGVGVLTAAIGVGGLVGAAGAILLVGRRGLGLDLAAGLVLWGLPITIIGLWPSPAAALLILPVIGIGNSLVDISVLTLLARVVEQRQLARMFACLSTLIMAGIALGSVAAPLLVSLLDARGALIVSGLLLPILALVSLPTLRRIDRSIAVIDDEIALLRGVPLMRPLPVPTLAQLAQSLETEHFEHGDTVCAQDEPGERFYIIESGEAEVRGDGRLLRRLGPGDAFGEIALLRHVPRTATVRACSDLTLRGLARGRFLAAVTGYSGSELAAEETVGTHLARFTPGVAGASTDSGRLPEVAVAASDVPRE